MSLNLLNFAELCIQLLYIASHRDQICLSEHPRWDFNSQISNKPIRNLPAVEQRASISSTLKLQFAAYCIALRNDLLNKSERDNRNSSRVCDITIFSSLNGTYHRNIKWQNSISLRDEIPYGFYARSEKVQ